MTLYKAPVTCAKWTLPLALLNVPERSIEVFKYYIEKGMLRGHGMGPREKTHLYPFRTQPMVVFYINYRGMELVFYSLCHPPPHRSGKLYYGGAHENGKLCAAGVV